MIALALEAWNINRCLVKIGQRRLDLPQKVVRDAARKAAGMLPTSCRDMQVASPRLMD